MIFQQLRVPYIYQIVLLGKYVSYGNSVLLRCTKTSTSRYSILPVFKVSTVVISSLFNFAWFSIICLCSCISLVWFLMMSCRSASRTMFSQLTANVLGTINHRRRHTISLFKSILGDSLAFRSRLMYLSKMAICVYLNQLTDMYNRLENVYF